MHVTVKLLRIEINTVCISKEIALLPEEYRTFASLTALHLYLSANSSGSLIIMTHWGA